MLSCLCLKVAYLYNSSVPKYKINILGIKIVNLFIQVFTYICVFVSKAAKYKYPKVSKTSVYENHTYFILYFSFALKNENKNIVCGKSIFVKFAFKQNSYFKTRELFTVNLCVCLGKG